jgi:hypothetical protein
VPSHQLRRRVSYAFNDSRRIHLMKIRSLTVIVAAGMIAAACSADSLDPAPSPDLRTGNKGSDTAIVSGPQTPPQVPPVVASFNLSGVVSGMEPGADTTRQSPLPNAGVTLVKVGTVEGDTLKPSVTVASTTTDANGAYRLENLPPAYYRIDYTAPAGSPFSDGSWGVGPARETEIRVNIALARKP